MSFLEIDSLNAGYGESQVLWDIGLKIAQGSITALVGANGAGKTTLMRAIAGLIEPMKGSIIFNGESLGHVPAELRVLRGIALVPEGRRLFAGLSVQENLMLGAFTRRDPHVQEDLAKIWRRFPELRPLAGQIAGTLSGGQQQMCAIGRSLMAKPSLLLVDEMSLGLAPVIVDRIAEALQDLNRSEGLTVLLVEQDVELALQIANFGYVIDTGRITMSGDSRALLENEGIREAYMGFAL